jgi:PHD/YefM family antitoxin component YafN of YafNO toxin-antitoxin module
MTPETVTITREEYEKLKEKAGIDKELLHELVQGLKDIKAGRVKKVR